MKDETLLQVDEDGLPIGFAKWANKKLPNDIGSMTIAYCEDAWRASLQSGNSAQPVTVPDELIHHDKDPEVTKAYKIGFNACLAVVKSATVTVPAGWIPVSERLPDPGVLVLVYAPPQPCDHPGSVRIGFDFIDPDGDDPTYWFDHGESYEHFCMVACDGMVGPTEKAPYTHWQPLPDAPKGV